MRRYPLSTMRRECDAGIDAKRHTSKGINMAKAKKNAANNDMAPEERERVTRVRDLWEQLKAHPELGRKLRRSLRSAGHRGGLKTPPPAI